MWIVMGRRVTSERVPEGKTAERTCQECGEYALFHEHQIAKTFSLYLIDVFNTNTQRAMACGACGALYVTDDYGGAGESTIAAVGEQLGSMFDRAGQAASEVFGSVSEKLQPVAEKASAHLSATVERITEEVQGKRNDEPASEGWVLPSFDTSSSSTSSSASSVSEQSSTFRTASPSTRSVQAKPTFDEEPREIPVPDGKPDPKMAELLRRFEALERRSQKKKDDGA